LRYLSEWCQRLWSDGDQSIDSGFLYVQMIRTFSASLKAAICHFSICWTSKAKSTVPDTNW
jgi:hypothetical protein